MDLFYALSDVDTSYEKACVSVAVYTDMLGQHTLMILATLPVWGESGLQHLACNSVVYLTPNYKLC